MENYGERLRAARKMNGLTQTELAEKLGITQKSYQRMESGNHDLKMSTIYKICQTLNVSADWLMGLNVNIQDKADNLLSKTDKRKKFEEILNVLDGENYDIQTDFNEPITVYDLIKNKPILIISQKISEEKAV